MDLKIFGLVWFFILYLVNLISMTYRVDHIDWVQFLLETDESIILDFCYTLFSSDRGFKFWMEPIDMINELFIQKRFCKSYAKIEWRAKPYLSSIFYKSTIV